MNENIKALVKDHLLSDKYNGDGDVIEGEFYEFSEKELLKVIENIVDECIDIAADNGDRVWYLAKHFGFK